MLQGLLLAVVMLTAPLDLQNSSPEELLAQVLEEPNAATEEMFVAIGAPGDPEALAALRECMKVVSDPSVLATCMTGFAGFGEDPVRRLGAMQTLLGVIQNRSTYLIPTSEKLRRERTKNGFQQGLWMAQNQATRVLLGYGEDAVPYLLDVFDRRYDARGHRLAIGGLGEHLAREGEQEGLDLFLKHYSPGFSGTREDGASVLAAFPPKLRDAELTKVLKDKSLRGEVRAMALLALAQSGADGLERTLKKHLDSDTEVLQLVAVEQLDRLGVTNHERKLERLVTTGGVRSRALRLAAFEALARSMYAARRSEDLGELLFDAAESKRLELRVGAARSLGLLRNAAAETKLVELLGDDTPEVRLAAIEGALELRVAAAIPVLIELQETDRLGIRMEARRALELLTGLDQGSGGRWRMWWEDEWQDFELPTRSAAERSRNERLALDQAGPDRTSVPPTFFGMPLTSDRVAFVLDHSRSMTTRTSSGKSRNAVVLSETLRTLGTLEDTAEVNVVFFTMAAWSWKGRLGVLSDRNRRSVRNFLLNQGPPDGGTNLLRGALQALEDPDLEELVLLTDGFTIQDEATLDRLLLELEVRACRVHTVGVGGRSELLTSIAEATEGSSTVH